MPQMKIKLRQSYGKYLISIFRRSGNGNNFITKGRLLAIRKL